MKFFDTHCHFNTADFDDQFIENFYENNKNFIINNVGVDITSSFKAVDLAYKYDNFYATIGVHPHEALQIDLDDVRLQMKKMLDNDYKKRIIAIGEIGLDYRDDQMLREAQIRLFKVQLEIAKEYDLVVNIHCRNHYEEVYSIIKQYNLKIIMHCFTSNFEDANLFLKIGAYISIPGIVTFKNATELRNAIKQIPIERLLIETDAPYLTPVPFRGKKNTPLYLIHTVNEIANVLTIDYTEICKTLFINALTIFNL